MKYEPLTDKQFKELVSDIATFKAAATQGDVTYLDELSYEADCALFYLEYARRKHAEPSYELSMLEREYDKARAVYLEAKAEAF